jgi:5-methyltetrahydrofolate--homocysteine methyltransferase
MSDRDRTAQSWRENSWEMHVMCSLRTEGFAPHDLACRALEALAARRTGCDKARLTAAAAQALLDALLDGDPEAVSELLCCARKTCGSFAAVADGPVAQAMQRLGSLWDEDGITFIDAMRAATTLKTALVACEDVIAVERRLRGSTILMATLDGQAHGLGSTLAGLALREAGHEVLVLNGAQPERIVDKARSEGVSAVGLSLGESVRAGVVSAVIAALRQLDWPPFVMLGGPAAAAYRQAASADRPDAVCASARAALDALDRLPARTA